MKRDINIFEFPLNLGLIKKEYEIEPRVKKLPDWFRKFDFHKKINPKNTFRLESPEYSMEFDEETGVKNPVKIIEYTKNQSEIISKNSDKNTFNIICRTEDGIDYKNLKEILVPLISYPQCFGIEITILDPDYDENGTYTKAFVENMIQIINK